MTKEKIFFLIILVIFIYVIFKYNYKIQMMYSSNSTSLYTPNSLRSDVITEKRLLNKFIEGKKLASQQKVLITGLIRDGEHNIEYIKKRMEAVGKCFSDYRIIIVENNSKDLTREKLLEWSDKNPKVIILGCGVNK